jgi:hypothetical protein
MKNPPRSLAFAVDVSYLFILNLIIIISGQLKLIIVDEK